MSARTITLDAPTPGGDLRLTVPVRVGVGSVTIFIETAHLEWLLRTAALLALRDGELLRSEPAWARVVPGHVSEVHEGATLCLQSIHIEVSNAEGLVIRVVEFPREVFSDFATARAAGMLGQAGEPGRVPGPEADAASGARPPVAFSLHAEGAATGRLGVAVPTLETMSIAALQARATAHGTPSNEWIVTFVSARARAGFDELARRSRASGVEAAGRVAARIGFDPACRCFVRVLGEVVIADDGPATAFSVVSTGGSWGAFIATAEDRRAPTSVHTHIHFDPVGPAPLAVTQPVSREPIISVDDVLTHLTAYPDPLSACVIESLFDDGLEIRLYGYTPTARLCQEAGFWLLGARGD